MSELFIPESTEWFVGELVEEFRAADSSQALVHVNLVLIKAETPDHAYDKALSFGESVNRVFTNTDGVEVRATFKGLRGLYVIYGPLGDGAELLYEKHEGMSAEAIASLVKQKQELAVFSNTWE